MVIVIAKAEAVLGDQSRILVRSPGTEPLIRVMVEAADFDVVNYWCDYLVDVVNRHLAE